MKMKKSIPDRWTEYLPVGQKVSRTRFIPFKVPLKERLCWRVPEADRFTPSILIEKVPHLKAVIDLTDTDRYYDPEEFTSRGVEHFKINIPGQKLPPISKLNSFYRVVDGFVEKYASDPDALLGVHCTHGLNRTGYLICKYMVERMKMDPREAISMFEEARGYPIERKVFTNDVCQVTKPPEFRRPEMERSYPNMQDRNRFSNPGRYNNNVDSRFHDTNHGRSNWRQRDERNLGQRDPYNRNNSYYAAEYANSARRGNVSHQSPLEDSDYSEPSSYYSSRYNSRRD